MQIILKFLQFFFNVLYFMLATALRLSRAMGIIGKLVGRFGLEQARGRII